VIYTEILGFHRRFIPAVTGPALISLLIAVALMPTTPEAVLTYYETIMNPAIEAYITYIVIIITCIFHVYFFVAQGHGSDLQLER